ncbi:MAG: GGDEF and EAL domain-containing protein [Gammaproteobacteria bacterium]|nr:GGDEF and EAL domain-containing protein [Gammaproteobacteria bacterium]
MAERRRGLTIGGYAVVMVVLVLMAIASYGAFTVSEFQRIRAEMDAASQQAAAAEVGEAMDVLLRDADEAAGRFAAWEEVRQQIEHPRYYPYWRSYRMLESGVLPDYVIDAEVYGADGTALTELEDSVLPHRVATPPPPAYVDLSSEQPTLLVFRSVLGPGDDADVRGVVGLRIAFTAPLKRSRSYVYVDPDSIHFAASDSSTLSWSDLKSAVRFELRRNPMSDAVSGLLSGTVANLSIVLGIFTLLLFPALVFLIVRPLRAISTHIDRLKDSPGGLVLGDLAGILPIAETEKIRESLNAYQGQLVDVHSTLEEKSQELWAMAHHDALTGAKNRRAFEEFMHSLPQALGDRDIGVCFALFDVNHFKAINDSYGHSVGDQVLKVIASRISSVLRKGEELFRIGGDEFAVVLLDCDESSALRIAERCHEKIVGHDFGKLGVREPLRISAGLANARIDDLDDLQTLQWKADVAMYRAKRPGHANVVMFNESLARDSEGLFSSWVNTAVYDAVVYGKGLVMYYQPIVDLTEGTVCHYEALVCIEQDGEIIQPSNIFPVVEARRLEVELDRAVIRKVLDDLKAGKVRSGTGVSINLSGPTLIHDQVCAWLGAFEPYLKDFRVMIEVTETALITQIGLANDNLSRLRARGFDIALDDFGSGYSSVRYLASMPVDVVKFDITLVQGLQDVGQANMVTHLARMILESGHHLVAEGIEDLDMLESARAAGFGRGQGYLMGRPAEHAKLDRVTFDNVTQFPSDRLA